MHTVCSAQDVVAADPTGKSDPYCLVSLAGSSEPTFRTETCLATLNPVWNQSFTFPPSSLTPFIHSTSQCSPAFTALGKIHTIATRDVCVYTYLCIIGSPMAQL